MQGFPLRLTTLIVLLTSAAFVSAPLSAHAQTDAGVGSRPIGHAESSRSRKNPGEAGVPREFVFFSSNLEPGKIASDLVRFYLTLYNTGRLSVSRNESIFAASIHQVFRKADLFFDDLLPIELDALACDLNSHVCSRFKLPTESFPNSAREQSGHILGTRPSAGAWAPVLGATLVLPDVKFGTTKLWHFFYKPSEKSLDTMVVSELRGCSSLDEACRKELLEANRRVEGDIFAPEFEGKLSLPVFTVSAMIDIGPIQDGALVPGLSLKEPRPDGPLELIQFRGIYGHTYRIREVQRRYPLSLYVAKVFPEAEANSNYVLRPLHSNIISGVTGDLQSTFMLPGDFHKGKEQILEHNRHPFKSADDLPPYAKNASLAVIDGWVDGSHCALEPTGRFEVHNITKGPITNGSGGNCNEMEESLESDHGTHIAGLAGGVKFRDKLWGLNPHARIVTYETGLAALSDPAQLQSLAKAIDDLRFKKVDVVNMSFGYVAPLIGRDPVQNAIASHQDSILFVAAAGNYGADKTVICDLRPACFNLPNVIAVAGLNANGDPSILRNNEKGQLSNYGAHIHVGAVGEAVLSAISNGRFGYMSGSSQAAPQVSAIAALTMARYPKARPIEIKNRLIYCSDHIGMLHKWIFGGKLNAECSVDGDQDWLSFSEDPGVPPLKGAIQKSGSIRYEDVNTGELVEFPVRQIRGIHFDSRLSTYIVFYNETSARDSTLLRKKNLRVQSVVPPQSL